MSQIMGAGGGGALVPANFADSPSPSVSLTAVPGTAITAKRSDEILALDQTAAYAFSGLGATNLLTGSALSWNSDFIITRGAAATGQLGAANVDTGSVNQTLRAQGVITGSGTSNVAGANLTIASGQGKGSAAGSSLIFQTPTAVASGTGAQTMTTRLTLDGAGLATFSGAISSGGSVTGTTFFASTSGGYQAANAAAIYWTNRFVFRSPADAEISLRNNAETSLTSLYIPSSNVLQIGPAPSASPVAQTLKVQDALTGNNNGASTFTIQGSASVGNGTSGDIVLQTGKNGNGSGVLATQTTALSIKGETQRIVANAPVGFKAYTVATLPAGVQGDNAYVTDALAPAFLAAVVGGGAIKTPVFYDGTNWVGA